MLGKGSFRSCLLLFVKYGESCVVACKWPFRQASYAGLQQLTEHMFALRFAVYAAAVVSALDFLVPILCNLVAVSLKSQNEL